MFTISTRLVTESANPDRESNRTDVVKYFDAVAPARYRARTYGKTNISRFRHGLLLLRMAWYAMWKLKFV